MSTPKTTLARNHSPTGCNQPVMTHLTKAERAELEQLANAQMRSLSATARLLIVQGLQDSKAAR
ncbi:hypothetical protein AKN92_09735 [Thiopseudomonas alkaliphila]|nr:hypothetical protein AKN92_09735 [Thiopseudomonas alkaliphila]